MTKQLEASDKRLISVLTEDGRMAVGQISKRLAVTSPTVRSRMKNLIQSGVLKIAALVDPFSTKGLTLALVGISLTHHQKLDQKLHQIANLNQVNWAVAVTGRHDIFVEVVLNEEMGSLYHFLTVELPKVGGIRSSESFVEMKAKRKWILLPKGTMG